MSSFASTLPCLGERYEAVRVIASGGMGIVLEARHRRLRRRVAVKLLGRALRGDREMRRRFEREARVASALKSTHAVRVHDFDVAPCGTPFLVMEHLDGYDLAAVVDREGPQPLARVASWAIQTCRALGELHALGFVHRDVKPSNLFLAERAHGATLKLLDFGVVRELTPCSSSDPASALGTPQYMSPEQIRCASDVDARSDVWSLGVSMFELLTGQPPFPHANPTACIVAVATTPVPDVRRFRPNLPERFAAVLMRALRKDRDNRWSSVSELAIAVAPFATSAPVLHARRAPIGQPRWNATATTLVHAM